jgi:hypothetical protein
MTDPNVPFLLPMHTILVAMDNPHELTFEWWLGVAACTVLSDHGGPLDERYACTKLRAARNSRIKQILESQGINEDSPDYWRHFHGYVTDVERVWWEGISGKLAISPSV